MLVRNLDVAGEPINTQFGEAHLDEFGTVINPRNIKGGVESLLKCAGFADAALFPPQGGYPEGYVPGDEEPEGSPEPVEAPKSNVIIVTRDKESTPGEYTEEDYWKVIQELSIEEENLNLKGYVEMEILEASLKALGWPVISGTQRRDITDKYRKIMAETTGQQGLPVEDE